MRILGPVLVAFALTGGAFAQVNIGGPAQVQDPAYPLKIRILERNIQRTKSSVRSWGRADLYDGPKAQGFDYQTDCNLIVMTSSGDERFSARWKKQGTELEILVTRIGARKPEKCAVKTNLQPFLYELESGTVTTEPLPEAPTPLSPPPAYAENAPITVEGWTTPEPGWLYVLDPKPAAGGPGGRIWLLDPTTGKTMGSIHTGDNADFALSPDGSRLYVTSLTNGNSSDLAVVDTAQGMILERGTVEDRAVANGLPPFSTMAVSADGSVLRILIVTSTACSDVDSFLLAAFDTQAGTFLSGSVHLGNCGPGRFISYASAGQIEFLCPRTNKIRLITADSNSREIRNVDVTLPWERRVGAADAIELPGAQNIAIVRGDGAVVEMDVATHGFADTVAQPELPNRVLPAAWPTSPDGNRIYLGYNKYYDRSYDNRFYLDYGRPPNVRPEQATAGEIRVLDTGTWRKIGTIRTSAPFWSATLDKTGKVLYAMAPQRHSVLVIDTTTLHETRTIKLDGMPALALVAP